MVMAESKSVQRTFSVRAPEDMYLALAKIAEREDRSVNAQIVRCLRECLARYDAAPAPKPDEG